MPRKTRYELEALNSPPAPGSEAYWKTKKIEAQARQSMLMAQHRKMLIDKMSGDLIGKDEVREMFHRVFSAYRQATREIDRRYGADAAAILIGAERSALRVQQQEKALCQTTQPKSSTPTSGKTLVPTTKRRAKSATSRKTKS